MSPPWRRARSLRLCLQRAGELVGAGSAVAALNALEERDDVLDLATDDELRDALRVAGASAHEFTRRHNAVRNLVVDCPRAGSCCLVGFHLHLPFCFRLSFRFSRFSPSPATRPTPNDAMPRAQRVLLYHTYGATTSQCPPLSGPTRRRLPDALSSRMFFSMPEIDSPVTSANS